MLDYTKSGDYPIIRSGGFNGMLVSFDGKLSEPANRAAISFRSAVESEGWDGVEEVSSSLVSVCLRFDPLHLSHDALRMKLEQLLNAQDWFKAGLPTGRRFWRIPTVFGTELAPQLGEAAAAAGLSEAEAIASLSNAKVRVQTIGFAPGQPYLGELPEVWDIPRQTELTDQVTEGALAVAIRQMVLFSASAPTGWRHIGQTAIKLFQARSENPFALHAGDELQFHSVSVDELRSLQSDPMGGATFEVIQ